jgi:hypothetical protein
MDGVFGTPTQAVPTLFALQKSFTPSFCPQLAL